MRKSVAPHLAYIRETLAVITENTPRTIDTFMSDRNAQDATLMRLQDIGEQLARIREQFPDFYEQYYSDDWPKLIGLRNIISHGYREVDFEIIWNIVTTKLPDVTNYFDSLKDIS
ncbi:MAG: HepT-like ribonuclease domain-containing protein [Candidatus Saccharimonadales bacterium]